MDLRCKACGEPLVYREAVHIRAHETAAYPAFKKEPFAYADICRECYERIFGNKERDRS